MSYAPAPTEGDDTIVGDDAADSIAALGGNDSVSAGAGNDTLDGGAGADTLAGGPGDDLYLNVRREDTVTELAGEGDDTVVFFDVAAAGVSGAVVVPLNVETFIFQGGGLRSVDGNAQDNRILGYQYGDDILRGLGGNDYLQGDYGSAYNANDILDGGDGDDVLWGDQGPGAAGNILYGRDVLHGGAGNDTLYGQIGNDTLYGDDGDDELWGDNGPGGPAGRVIGYDVLYGGAGNDTLHGQAGSDSPYVSDRLYGGEGDDLLADAGYMEGGPGNDTYLFELYIGRGTVIETPVAGEVNTVRVSERIAPSAVQAWREGDDLALYVTGYQDSALVVKDYYGAAIAPIERVVFADGTQWGMAEFADAPLGPPPGTAPVSVVGSADADRLEGGSGNDTLDGAGGNDLILGAAGDDVLIGGAGDDTLAGGRGNDRIDAGSGRNLVSYVAGDGDDVFTAPASAGGADANTIDLSDFHYGDGGTGPLRPEELILVRAGDDLVLTVFNTPGSLTVRDYFAQADAGLFPIAQIVLGRVSGVTTAWDNAQIAAHLQAPPPPPPTDDVLVGGAGDDVLRAGGGDDLIVGNAGNDFLDGQEGTDTLDGGAGDDTLVVDNPLDVVLESGNGGLDTVQSYIDWRLPAHVENLILIGAVARVGEGNMQANAITGNALANLLRGGGGDDTLAGGGGADTLEGGTGRDLFLLGAGGGAQVDGGQGRDTAVYDGLFADYGWSIASGGPLSITGAGGTDTLADVEFLRFADALVEVQYGHGREGADLVVLTGVAAP